MAENIQYIILIIIMVSTVIFDLQFVIIPNWLILVAILLRCTFIYILLISNDHNIVDEIIDTIMGSLVATAIALTTYKICNGQFGAGDGKLTIVIGFYLGLDALLPCLFIIVIIMVSTCLILLHKKIITVESSFPMAPFISIGVIIYLSLEFLYSVYNNFGKH